MKLLFIALTLTFLICTEARKFDHVRKYLAEHDESRKPTLTRNNPFWLKNSNTIGLGYNPLYGSPVCYSGACQADGFRRSVFKLNYTQSAIGSCTSKFIPNFVELQCLPSAELRASTEIISTLEQLSESTSQGISFGVDVKYNMFSAGYSHSSETRFMTDQIVKKDTTVTFTHAEVTFGKLSIFEPLLELADTFQYVIQEMPCCDDSSLETDEYIREFFIDYFGLTFVTELILGGIAQETMSIGNRELRKMQSEGKDVSHSASIGFFLTFNIKTTSSSDTAQLDEFMNSVKTRDSTKLGGDPSAQRIEDWIKSVPENPVIMKYAVKDILKLLTPKNFPNDSYIHNKSKLVEMAIERYLYGQNIICLNNCTDLNHGECNMSSITPFLLGTCECRSGWKGNDCSKRDCCSKFDMKENWDYNGNDLDLPTTKNTYEDCYVECSKHERCNAFTWNYITNECFIKSSIGYGGHPSSSSHAGARKNIGDIVPGGTYKLINSNSGKALDVEGAGKSVFTNVGIATDNNNPAQLWTIYDNEDDTVRLINPNSGMALDVSNAGTADGTNVQIVGDNRTGAQKWILNSEGDGIYTLINVISGKALHVGSAGTSDETNVNIWEQNGTEEEK